MHAHTPSMRGLRRREAPGRVGGSGGCASGAASKLDIRRALVRPRASPPLGDAAAASAASPSSSPQQQQQLTEVTSTPPSTPTRRSTLLLSAAAAAASSPAFPRRALANAKGSDHASFDPLVAAASAIMNPPPEPAGAASGPTPSPPLPRVPRAASIPRALALKGMSAVVRGTRQLDGRHRGTAGGGGGNGGGGGAAGGGGGARGAQIIAGADADADADRTRGGDAIADLGRFWRAGVTSYETSDAFGSAETLLGQFLRLEPRAAVPGAAKVIATLSFSGLGAGGSLPLTRADVRPAALELRVRAACARLGVASLDHVQLAWAGGDAPGRGPPLPASLSGAAAAAAGAQGGTTRRGLFGLGRRRGGGGDGGGDDYNSHNCTTPLWLDALLALQDLRQRRGGLVAGVGVVGFSAARLLRALDAGVDVATNLVPLSVVDRRAVSQRGLSALCAERRVALLARGCLLGGFLQEGFLGLPASAARLDTDAKMEYGRVVRASGGWDRLQDQLEVLSRVGRAHNASASTVALRWALQQEAVAALVVGARNARHVGDLRRAFSFQLAEDELLDIDAAYESAAQPTGDVGEWERGGEW